VAQGPARARSAAAKERQEAHGHAHGRAKEQAARAREALECTARATPRMGERRAPAPASGPAPAPASGPAPAPASDRVAVAGPAPPDVERKPARARGPGRHRLGRQSSPRRHRSQIAFDRARLDVRGGNSSSLARFRAPAGSARRCAPGAPARTPLAVAVAEAAAIGTAERVAAPHRQLKPTRPRRPERAHTHKAAVRRV
jgi:hypothetical protein